MTKRASFSVRSLARVIALGVVALQLLNVLHFTLVPHGFGAGPGGLVHLHRALVGAPERALPQADTESTLNRALGSKTPSLGSSSVASTPDECALGFSGPPTRPVASSQLSALIAMPAPCELASREIVACDRGRALLSAPKTSPPNPA